MYKLFSFCFLILLSNVLIGQYVSGVTTPDTTKAMITSLEDQSVRYANNIRPEALRFNLNVIASDSMQGRETGQPGIDKARNYIVKTIGNMGLLKIPGTDSYLQPVSFTYSNWAETGIHVNKELYRHLWDYLAFPDKNNSLTALMEKEVIFLGYGIEDEKYNDYKKVDVKGKIIMINRGEPTKKDGTSYITGKIEASDWSNADMDRKLKIAKSKGVALVLIIENDIKKLLGENRSKLLNTNLELGNSTNKEIPYGNHVYISSNIAKAIIGDKEKDIIKARNKIAKGKPKNVKLETDFIISLIKKVTLLEGNNIIGYIEGGSKKDEFVIVSAHYDHLGMKGDEIYNGADDNGSGTVTLIQLAQAAMASFFELRKPERSIVFLWVCGEEKGLLGSEYYAANPIFPLKNTIANVNVDMVGRVDEKYKDNPNYIYVIGSDRLSSDLHKINEEVNQKYSQLTLDYTYNDENDSNKYYYRSDHYNFAKNGIPAIFYFNGTHEDYHRTSDTVEKINFDKMANVGKLIFHTVWELANRPDRIRVDGVVK